MDSYRTVAKNQNPHFQDKLGQKQQHTPIAQVPVCLHIVLGICASLAGLLLILVVWSQEI